MVGLAAVPNWLTVDSLLGSSDWFECKRDGDIGVGAHFAVHLATVGRILRWAMTLSAGALQVRYLEGLALPRPCRQSMGQIVGGDCCTLVL